jgi:hypothetical protein
MPSLPGLPGLPEINTTIEIVAVSSTGALLIAGVLAFIFGTIRALMDGSPSQPHQPKAASNPHNRF